MPHSRYEQGNEGFELIEIGLEPADWEGHKRGDWNAFFAAFNLSGKRGLGLEIIGGKLPVSLVYKWVTSAGMPRQD